MRKSLIRLAFTTALGAMLVQAAPALAKTPNDQLVIGTSLAQVLSLDPHQATEAKANEIMANLYDRLISVDGSGKVSPQLAERWETDDKGITFHLREANFASGNPVTSADVVYSLSRLLKMNQAAAANLKRVGYNADNIDKLVSAPDEKRYASIFPVRRRLNCFFIVWPWSSPALSTARNSSRMKPMTIGAMAG